MNPNAHIWLYAKHRYPETKDLIADLRQVVGKTVALPPCYVGEGEVLNVLLELAFQIINKPDGNPPVAFQDFTWRLRRFAEPCREGENLGLPLIRACLSVIETAMPPRDVSVEDIDKELWWSLKGEAK